MQQQSITPWVFSYAGRPIASIKSAFQNARIEAGLPERRIHDTRRTFRRYLALGVSDKVGQQIMGHKDLKTYQAYFPRPTKWPRQLRFRRFCPDDPCTISLTSAFLSLFCSFSFDVSCWCGRGDLNPHGLATART